MNKEFEGKRYAPITYQRETTNLVTGEKTKYPNRYGIYDESINLEVAIPNFHPLSYSEARQKAIELNELDSVVIMDDDDAMVDSYMDNLPILSEVEQKAEIDKLNQCADYILKHGLTPNLDSIY